MYPLAARLLPFRDDFPEFSAVGTRAGRELFQVLENDH